MINTATTTVFIQVLQKAVQPSTVATVIVPISHTLHTESTLRIHWFPHHTFLLPRTAASQTNRFADYRTIINLLISSLFYHHFVA